LELSCTGTVLLSAVVTAAPLDGRSPLNRPTV
jgi:hypothetical protein